MNLTVYTLKYGRMQQVFGNCVMSSQTTFTLQNILFRMSFKFVSDGGARDFAKKMERWGSSLKTLK